MAPSASMLEEAVRYKLKTARLKSEAALRSRSVDEQVEAVLRLMEAESGYCAPRYKRSAKRPAGRARFMEFLRKVKRRLERVPLFKKIIAKLLGRLRRG